MYYTIYYTFKQCFCYYILCTFGFITVSTCKSSFSLSGKWHKCAVVFCSQIVPMFGEGKLNLLKKKK